jgi:predicted dehydrogenase
MRTLFGERWLEGLADAYRAPGQCRIEVEAIVPLERLDDVYPVRDRRDLRMVWNYLRAIGVRDTLRKVVSRSREGLRNEKFVSCGIGRVIEAAEGGTIATGHRVVFLCPVGAAASERLVLPEALLLPVEAGTTLPALDDDAVALNRAAAEAGEWWQPVRGWRPESGEALPTYATQAALKEAQRLVLGADWSAARKLPRGDEPVRTVFPAARAGHDPRRKRATLFGHGNYAKTILLPRLSRHLDVDCVHEIDPAQIPRRRADGVRWDTSPVLDADERPDAVLIASYHHTHADLAAEALRRGAAALVEKPIATTRRQLHDLLATLRATGGALFSGYQRRYLPFNDWAREDLGLGADDPVNYHAIVYEVSLPELHWYRWPSSRSRLVSNGCHWIDHFLHLNRYAAPSEFDVRVGRDGTTNCSVTLENGAFFSMVLTDQGSRRLGVRDHVELRAAGATVRIEDACRYEAEDRHRVLRRGSLRRLEAYERMYDAIGRKIAAGEPGDTPHSLQRSAGLVLDLQDQLVRLERQRRFSPGSQPISTARPAPLRQVAAA